MARVADADLAFLQRGEAQRGGHERRTLLRDEPRAGLGHFGLHRRRALRERGQRHEGKDRCQKKAHRSLHAPGTAWIAKNPLPAGEGFAEKD